MPCEIFGANSSGLPKSAGASSIQNFSSFCHRVSAPSIFLASLITVANGCGWPGTGAAGPDAGADAPRAATAGADAAPACAVAAPGAPAGVAQPAAANARALGRMKDSGRKVLRIGEHLENDEGPRSCGPHGGGPNTRRQRIVRQGCARALRRSSECDE